MNRRLKRALCLFGAASLVTLCGCGGENTVYRRNSIEMVREVSPAQYNLTQVRRGDISLEETVRVEYFAARQESMGFSSSGLYYDNIGVEVGDQVAAGDVLATLECTEIDAGIAQCKADLASLEAEIARNQALLDLLDARNAEMPQRRHSYEVAIRNAQDECAVIDAELAELEQKRAGRVIIAPIDGTVTFVRDISPGETSVNGRTIITITDLDSCAFTSTVENPQALDPEKIYTVTIDGAQYELQLSSAQELGIEDVPMNEKSTRTKVYFRILTPSVNLTNDSSGRFSVVVDAREDVLFIPATALTTVDSNHIENDPAEDGHIEDIEIYDCLINTT